MLLKESFRLNSLPYEERDKIYDIFKQSYEKATGHAWNRSKFDSRASDWLFFGDTEGFVTVRPQQSGYYKLTGVAGSRKGIMQGLQELSSGNHPTWAMLTPELASILIRRYGFKKPNKVQSYLLSKLLDKRVFGNVDYTKNKDGSITFKYGDVGEATKVFVGSDEYFRKLKRDILSKVSWRNLFKGDILKEDLNEEDLNELRAVSSYSEDNFEALKKYLEKYGYENTYVSFRDRATTNWVNPKNQYGTPTGFYCYPIWKFPEKLQSITTIGEFKNIFPYHGTNPFRYMVLFRIENYDEILRSQNTNQEKVDMFVERVRNHWKNDEQIQKLCDDYKNDTLNAYYPNGSTSDFRNEFQKLWLFIYTIAKTLGGKLNIGFTKVANKINLSGFVDDACTKVIHEGEPCQAVFFPHAKNTILNQITIDTHQEVYDAPIDIDRDNQRVKTFTNHYSNDDTNAPIINRFFYEIFKAENFGGVSKREIRGASTSVKYNLLYNAGQDKGGIGKIAFIDGGLVYVPKQEEKVKNQIRFTDFIKKKLGVKEIAFDKTYRSFISKGLPFFVTVTDPLGGRKSMFINKNGDEDIRGLTPEAFKDSPKALAAFLNSKHNTSYVAVHNYGYAGNPNHARADVDSGGTQQSIIINKLAEPEIKGVDEQWLFENQYGNEDVVNWYFGQKFGTEVKGLVKINDKALYITDAEYKGRFVNMEGMDDLSNIEPHHISSNKLQGAFINQKFGTDYASVGGFQSDNIGEHVGIATTKEGKTIYINEKGEPDVSGVDVNNTTSTQLAIYYNQINNTDYYKVHRRDGLNYLLAQDQQSNRIIINKDGLPDVSMDIDIDLLESDERALFYNQKYGSEWRQIGNFGRFAPDIAIATTGGWHASDTKFINKQGKPSTKNVRLNKVDKGGEEIRAAFINQKFGTDWRTINPFGGGELAYAYDREGNKKLINKKGSTDISKADLEKIRDTYMRADFINSKFNKEFQIVGEFGKYGTGRIAAATTKDGQVAFITPKGNLSIQTVDFNKVNANGNTQLLAAYFRQKYGTKYKSVQHFGDYASDPNVALAYINGIGNAGDMVLINKAGEPDTGKLKLDDLIVGGQHTLAAALINQRYGTEYKSIHPIRGADNSGGYVGKTHDNETVFINDTGSPDTDGIDFLEMDTESRGRYFRQRYGKNYWKVLSFPGENEDDPEILVAVNDDGKKIFINDKGEPDVSVITPKHASYLGKTHSDLLPQYFNQRFGTKYSKVHRIGTYPLYYAHTRNEKGGGDSSIININGHKSLDGLNWEIYNDLGSQIQTIYVNQKLGTNFAETGPLNDENVFFAEKFVDKNSNHEILGVYLNTEGKPDVSGVSMEMINDNPLRLTAYINQNFGKDYKQVTGFKKDGGLISVAYTKDGNTIHINLEGEPVDFEEGVLDLSSGARLEYFKTKFGKDFERVTDFIYGENPNKNAIAAAKDTGASGHHFINQKGEPTLDGVDPHIMKTNEAVVDLTKQKIAELEKSKEPKKKDDSNKINEMIIDEIFKLL